MRFFPIRKIVTPFWRLVVLLVLIPMLELFLCLYFLGTTLTLLTMLVSGVFGVFVAYREGLQCWKVLVQQLERGQTPTTTALHGVLIITAAFFMILPGILTSLLGLLLLFSLTRTIIASYATLYFEARRARSQKRGSPHSPEIIDIS